MAEERQDEAEDRSAPAEDRAKALSSKGRNAARPARVKPSGAPTRSGRRRGPDPQQANAIEPTRPRHRSASQERSAPSGQKSAPDEQSKSARSEARAADGTPAHGAAAGTSDPYALPASVRDRFIEDRHRFYFEDGTPAFRDHGRRLTTASENTEVIRSLIDIARTRGWEEITVNGTERFREAAWRQGRYAGLTVRGYRATEAERQSVVRAIGRQAHGAQRELDVGGGDAERGGDARAVAQSEHTSRGVAEPQRADGRGDLLVGKLLDHGRDTYRFDPREPMSYFVEIETAQRKRTIWGKDLERALRESLTQPKIGDEIGMRRTGADRVTVHRKERGDNGEVIAEREVGAERARWVLEKREFFESRAAAASVLRNPTVDRRQAVRNHPELVGTYLQLRAAELAAKRIRDPEDQKKFVALVRQALADSVARGEPLQPVRLRERSQRVPERKAREREPGPVRT
jgi:hypothetical protein